MLQLGIIQPPPAGPHPWTWSPRKQKGIGDHVTSSYRAHNNSIVPDRYSITASLQPFLTLIWCMRTTRFRGYTKNCTIRLFSNFSIQPEEHRPKVMFQRFIDEVLRGSSQLATPENNLQHLQSVLVRLEQHGIVIKVTESVFGVNSWAFSWTPQASDIMRKRSRPSEISHALPPIGSFKTLS